MFGRGHISCRNIRIAQVTEPDYRLLRNLRNRLWLLKNSSWSLVWVKSGDQKCLEIREDRLYGILARFNFYWFGRVGVFQQPRDVSPTDRMLKFKPAATDAHWYMICRRISQAPRWQCKTIDAAFG
jgi:hypothetical protein